MILLLQFLHFRRMRNSNQRLINVPHVNRKDNIFEKFLFCVFFRWIFGDFYSDKIVCNIDFWKPHYFGACAFLNTRPDLHRSCITVFFHSWKNKFSYLEEGEKKCRKKLFFSIIHDLWSLQERGFLWISNNRWKIIFFLRFFFACVSSFFGL